jgi:hypothetical protein
VLPLSLVPLTRPDACLDGLTAYRHDGSASSADVQFGLETSLWAFLDVAELAVDQAVHFTSEISDLRARWREQLAASEALRTSGKSCELTRPARGSSSCFRNIAGHRPTVQRMLAVSPLAARIALEALADADRDPHERGTGNHWLLGCRGRGCSSKRLEEQGGAHAAR